MSKKSALVHPPPPCGYTINQHKLGLIALCHLRANKDAVQSAVSLVSRWTKWEPPPLQLSKQSGFHGDRADLPISGSGGGAAQIKVGLWCKWRVKYRGWRPGEDLIKANQISFKTQLMCYTSADFNASAASGWPSCMGKVLQPPRVLPGTLLANKC